MTFGIFHTFTPKIEKLLYPFAFAGDKLFLSDLRSCYSILVLTWKIKTKCCCWANCWVKVVAGLTAGSKLSLDRSFVAAMSCCCCVEIIVERVIIYKRKKMLTWCGGSPCLGQESWIILWNYLRKNCWLGFPLDGDFALVVCLHLVSLCYCFGNYLMN